VQQIGGATGIAVAGIIFFDGLGPRPGDAAFTSAFGDSLLLLTAVSVLSGGLMRLLPGTRAGTGAGTKSAKSAETAKSVK